MDLLLFDLPWFTTFLRGTLLCANRKLCLLEIYAGIQHLNEYGQKHRCV
jgi:hypothetical protein